MIDHSHIKQLSSIRAVGTKNINAVTEQVHAAAQYPAMVGKFYGVHKDDDSHTNLAWNLTDKVFNGRWHKKGNLRVSVAPIELLLRIENGQDLKAIELHGMSRMECIGWVRTKLSELGFDGNLFDLSFHYDLPEYALMKDLHFQKQSLDLQVEFANFRTWGTVFCDHYRKYFPLAHESRTWPHHFDHGCYIPVDMDGEKVVRSFSLGLAIHDSICPEHYFYTTFWNREKLQYDQPEPLSFGRWEIENLSGALLPVSSLYGHTMEQQLMMVSTYFEESINGCLQLLGISPQNFS